MRVLVAAVLSMVMLPAGTAHAQQVDPRCMDESIVGATLEGGDACQKVIDIFTYMNPQLGMLITGGNATLGQGGVLGGFGRFLIGGRINVLRASIPDLGSVGVANGPAQMDTYRTESRTIPMPIVDGAFGVFRGFPLGGLHVGGLDVLVSMSYMPEVERSDIAIEVPGSSFRFGWGVRVGLIEETILLPAVSVTFIRRDLPRLTMHARVDDDTVSMQNLEIRPTAWRIVASKSLRQFTVGGGIGQDRYDTRAQLTYVVRDGAAVSRPDAPFPWHDDPTRLNMFVDLSVHLSRVRLMGELGRVSGGNIRTYNRFVPRADAPRTYGTLGFRFEL
jgi:hypothetical protein